MWGGRGGGSEGSDLRRIRDAQRWKHACITQCGEGSEGYYFIGLGYLARSHKAMGSCTLGHRYQHLLTAWCRDVGRIQPYYIKLFTISSVKELPTAFTPAITCHEIMSRKQVSVNELASCFVMDKTYQTEQDWIARNAQREPTPGYSVHEQYFDPESNLLLLRHSTVISRWQHLFAAVL